GNVSNYFYESLVNISEKTFIRIKYNLLDIYDTILMNENKIGGDGIIVEVDETVISRNRTIKSPSAVDDNTPGLTWLFGCIERNNTNNFRIIIVPDRTIETLTNILQRYVKQKSIIISDGYPSYPKAVQNNHFKHIVVTHVDGFVNSEGESTNKIENLWSHLKSDIRKDHGVMFSNINNFLRSFSFRKRYLTNISSEKRR
ncbi:hypothetical protein DMUE_6362, partial [Dictyocoela muelleri]